ncbi:hypothetical protein AGMMS49545_21010 [Betaproteobacteria bacterium]|nr:hypothetical protein AGMMS49545_21010 [Betaproteobacteria bacterium]
MSGDRWRAGQLSSLSAKGLEYVNAGDKKQHLIKGARDVADEEEATEFCWRRGRLPFVSPLASMGVQKIPYKAIVYVVFIVHARLAKSTEIQYSLMVKLMGREFDGECQKLRDG